MRTAVRRSIGTGVVAMAVFTGAVLTTQAVQGPSRDDVTVQSQCRTYVAGWTSLPCDDPPERVTSFINISTVGVGCAAGAARGGGIAGCLAGALSAAAGLVAAN